MQLVKADHKFKQTEWNAYFDSYLEVSLETIIRRKEVASTVTDSVSPSAPLIYLLQSELTSQMLSLFLL